MGGNRTLAGNTTLDSICRGELWLEQPAKGYRFNLDSVLLAHFTEEAVSERVERLVDLGAGCGIVGLLLAKRWPHCRVVLVELQEELAALSRKNSSRNDLELRVEVRCADLRTQLTWSEFAPQLIVCNPPFFKASRGRASPRIQVSIAKHEIACTLEELLTACAHGLGPAAALSLIYPMDRQEELLVALEGHGLFPVRLRQVQPFPQKPPTRVLVLARRGVKQELTRLDPLVIEAEPGLYTREMCVMLGDDS
jgi:tRNA1Val (adenine37-N6)-methyltransferase